jgi:hypothetical protein
MKSWWPCTWLMQRGSRPGSREPRQVLLAIDGMQPDVGHEVLWIIRDGLSGEVLLARTLLSSTRGDLAALLKEVQAVLDPLAVSIKGIVSDGQQTIRQAVERSLLERCHISSATFTIWMKRRDRSSRRIGMPKPH